VHEAKPQAVIHLAGIAFVAHGDVKAIYDTNIIGTRNLLQALHEARAAVPSQIILASSANIYGNSTHEPIGEEAPPQPANDYAVSKLAMEFAA
jgi:nucleoside-diphosphate-sugar epimerase